MRTDCVYPVAGMVGAGVGGICHVGFWSFKREFLISSGLTWFLFIVAVEMISRLPRTTQQNRLMCPNIAVLHLIIFISSHLI